MSALYTGQECAHCHASLPPKLHDTDTVHDQHMAKCAKAQAHIAATEYAEPIRAEGARRMAPRSTPQEIDYDKLAAAIAARSAKEPAVTPTPVSGIAPKGA